LVDLLRGRTRIRQCARKERAATGCGARLSARRPRRAGGSLARSR
jgi:hypothetical protein